MSGVDGWHRADGHADGGGHHKLTKQMGMKTKEIGFLSYTA
jgi:hypothetical protein